MLLMVAIARLNGAADMGAYSLTMANYTLMANIARLNADKIIIRDIVSRPKHRKSLFMAASLAMFLISLPFALVVLVAPQLLGYGDNNIVLYTASLAFTLPFEVLLYVTDAGFISIGRTDLVAFRQTMLAVLRVGTAIIVIANNRPFAEVFLAYLGATLAVVVSQVPVVIKMIGLAWPQRRHCYAFFSQSLLQFGALTLASTVFTRLDILALGRWGTLTEVGIYAAGYFPFSILAMVVSQAVLGVFPQLVSLSRERQEAMLRLGLSMARTLVFFGLPFALMGGPLLSEVVVFLYGSEFVSAAKVAPLIMLAIIPSSAEYVLSSSLFATGNQRVSVVSDSLGVLVALPLYALLVPTGGAIGTAIAFLGAYVVIVLSTIGFGYRSLVGQISISRTWSWLTTAVVAALILSVALGMGLSLQGAFVLGGLVYIICSLLTGSLKTEISRAVALLALVRSRQKQVA